eukprot:m51a1_g4820 hypothetical protein (818) ;mRNA; f:156993-160422
MSTALALVLLVSSVSATLSSRADVGAVLRPISAAANWTSGASRARGDCQCVDCYQRSTIQGGKELVLTPDDCGVAGYRVLTSLAVASTDGSGFTICATYEGAPKGWCYTNASSPDALTCIAKRPLMVGDVDRTKMIIKIGCLFPKDGQCMINTRIETTCKITLYEWVMGNWSACGPNCWQNRTAQCKREGGVAVYSADRCTISPWTSQRCEAEGCAKQYDWRPSEWSTCIAGQQHRTLSCLETDDDSPTAIPSDESLCTKTRPPTTQSCTPTPGVYAWQVGEWGPCVDCAQNRSVECVSAVTGAAVAEVKCASAGRKEKDTQKCYNSECITKGYKWELGEWSKCKSDCTKTRSVSCVDASSGAKVEEWSRAATNWTSAAPRARADSDCQCVGCKTPYTIPFGQQLEITSNDNCGGWRYPVLAAISVASTDGSGILLCTTYEGAPEGTCYTNVSSPHAVSCITRMPLKVGRPDRGRLVVKIGCVSPVGGQCKVNTNVQLDCVMASYTWVTGDWSACGPHCGQTRTVQCKLAGDDALYSGGNPAQSETGVYSGDKCIFKPATTQRCTVSGCVKQYDWLPSVWSACIAGEQKRSVTCADTADFLGSPSPESLCTKPRPPTTQSCTPTPGAFAWYEGEWGPCVGCVQNRTISCVNAETGAAVAEDKCERRLVGGDDKRPCYDIACWSGYKWVLGEWSACGSACTKTRSISCIKIATGATVAEDRCALAGMKAEDTLRCSGGACLSAGYRWELGEWSKCGSDCTKTRSVSCVDASSGAKTDKSKCPGFESTSSPCTDCSSGGHLVLPSLLAVVSVVIARIFN